MLLKIVMYNEINCELRSRIVKNHEELNEALLDMASYPIYDGDKIVFTDLEETEE